MSSDKPKCAVRGLVLPNAMCSSVIVGGVYCGYSGWCENKISPCDEEPQSDVQAAVSNSD